MSQRKSQPQVQTGGHTWSQGSPTSMQQVESPASAPDRLTSFNTEAPQLAAQPRASSMRLQRELSTSARSHFTRNTSQLAHSKRVAAGGSQQHVEECMNRSFISTASTRDDPERRAQLARIAVKGVKQIKARVDESKAVARPFSLREKVYCLFDPSADMPSKAYATASTVIALVLLVLIFVSVATFMIESLPRFEADSSDVLFGIEAVCVSMFTIEYLARLITTAERADFLRDLYNGIDLLAVVPFWVGLVLDMAGMSLGAGDSLVFLRLLRLIRVLRVFKLGQYSRPLQVVMYTLARSVTALSLLVFLLGIGTILFSSLLFLAEQTEDGQSFHTATRQWVRKNGKPSPFQSIPHCFWWAMVTLTTVGYGDEVPVSTAGKFVGSACILVGIFVLAFPVILISHNFNEVMEDFKEVQMDELVKETERDDGQLEVSVVAALGRLDAGSPGPPLDATPSRLERSPPGTPAAPGELPSAAAISVDIPSPMAGASPELAALSEASPQQQTWADLAPPRGPLPLPVNPLVLPDRDPPPSGQRLQHSPHYGGRGSTQRQSLADRDAQRLRWAEPPPPGTVVAHFQYEKGGKQRLVRFHGVAGEVFQFRYDPLFVPLSTLAGDLDLIICANRRYFVHLEVCVDTQRAQDRCHDVVTRSGLFDPRRVPRQGSCFARQLRRVGLRIPHLPDGCRLTTDVWHSPSGVVPVHVAAPDADTLARLVRLLPDITLHFDCVLYGNLSGMAGHLPELQAQSGSDPPAADTCFEVTVPLNATRLAPLGDQDHQTGKTPMQADSVLYEDIGGA